MNTSLVTDYPVATLVKTFLAIDEGFNVSKTKEVYLAIYGEKNTNAPWEAIAWLNGQRNSKHDYPHMISFSLETLGSIYHDSPYIDPNGYYRVSVNKKNENETVFHVNAESKQHAEYRVKKIIYNYKEDETKISAKKLKNVLIIV